MTRWKNTSVYRALGTLSALPVRALSRLPLKAGKRRCGLSFSQWFLLLGMGAMLCVPHGAWNNLYAVLFALAALLVYWFGCAAQKNTPRNIGDLGPAALGFLLMTVLCTLWAGNKAGNLRVALFFWTGFLLAYLTAAQFRTRIERRAAADVHARRQTLLYRALRGADDRTLRSGKIVLLKIKRRNEAAADASIRQRALYIDEAVRDRLKNILREIAAHRTGNASVRAVGARGVQPRLRQHERQGARLFRRTLFRRRPVVRFGRELVTRDHAPRAHILGAREKDIRTCNDMHR